LGGDVNQGETKPSLPPSAADGRSALLAQLKIERVDEKPRRNRWSWVAGALAIVAAVAVGAWLLFLAPSMPVVQVATAQPASANAESVRNSALDASGYVVARRQATVSAKITGRVVDVLIEEGQQVAADEIVARLDDTNARARHAQAFAQLAQQRATLEAASVALGNAEPTFARSREQFERQVTSAQEFDSAKATYDAVRMSADVARRGVEVAEATLALAQRELDDTIVRAPFAGIVTVKAAQEGEMVSPISAGGGFTRTGIGTIVDMDSLEVEVDVSESFINRVKPDQDVTVTLNAYPDWKLPAYVIAIIPTADRAKATVRVRVGFRQRDARILPEMGVRVAFLSDSEVPVQSTAPAVVVPERAVQVSGDTGTVFVVQDEMLERRAVRVGGTTAEGRIVLSGIAVGAQLAVGDFSLLANGMRVRTAEGLVE
jgi:RND family efflux transporter MFP subunit